MTTISGTEAVVVLLLLLVWKPIAPVAAIPNFPDCGSPVQVASERVVLSKEIDADGLEQEFLTLSPEEGVLLQVTTGGRRRLRRERRRSLFDVESLGFCGQVDDDGEDVEDDQDDLIAQPNFDDGLVEEDCDFEDDDNVLSEQNAGGDSQQVIVDIVDALSGVVSRKIPFSVSNESSEFLMWSRGQKSQCGHPTRIRVRGQEGRGLVEVSVIVLRRPGFNTAALSFSEAIDVGSLSSKKEWCGSVNLIAHEPDPSCDERANTPKWKVYLNPNDKLMVAAELYCREDIAETSATKVEVKLFRAPEMITPQTVIIDARIVGRKTKRGDFVNTGPGSWFYIELFRSRRHLYEYGIAFEVQRGCADENPGKYVLPKDDKTCGWLAGRSNEEIGDICRSIKSNANANCRRTCGECTSCPETSSTSFYIRQRNCRYLQKKKNKLVAKGKFDKYCDASVAGAKCPATCGECP